jgi:hypothetical protein
MSPMNRVARRVLPLLILLCSCSASLFAAPLITHSLGISTGANSLLDVSSGSTRFRLSSGLGGTELMSADAGKRITGDGATSSAGTVSVQNGPKSGGGLVGSAGGYASDQGSAHTSEATSGAEETGQAAITGPVRQVTLHPDGSGAEVETAKGRTGRLNPADGAIPSGIRAADPAAKNRATAGQVSSIRGGSGASQVAAAVTDANSGSRSPSNTQGKATTDTTAPVASLAPSSPTVSSQQAATPPGQSGSVSSNLANQAVSNAQGASSSPPSNPALSSQLNSAGAAPIAAGAGTPAASSSSAAPANSAGATASAATPQSGGSTPPASVAGPAGAPSAGSNLLSSGSTAAQSPQSSSPSTVSIAPATASMLSIPPGTAPATAGAGSANPSGVSSTDDHLAAQFLISLSPSLTNVLGGAGSTVVSTSNPVSTTSALSTGGTSSSSSLSGSLASSDLPLPSVDVASQILVNPAPDATSTGLVMGILPQNIPEPRILDMLMVLVTVLALRHVCGHGVPGVRSARGCSIEKRDGDLCGEASVGDEQGLVGPQALTLCGLADGTQKEGRDGLARDIAAQGVA